MFHHAYLLQSFKRIISIKVALILIIYFYSLILTSIRTADSDRLSVCTICFTYVIDMQHLINSLHRIDCFVIKEILPES